MLRQEDLPSLLKALSEPNRMRIVAAIARDREVYSSLLLDELGISQPTLSHHMKTLCSSGLVLQQRKGQRIYYTLDQGTLNGIECFFDELAASNRRRLR